MTPLSRSAALALGGAFLATPMRALAQTPSSLKVGLNTNESTVQAYFADQAGIFTRHGLEVELDRMSGGAAVAAAMSGGTLQVGASNVLSFAVAVSRGLPFTAIAPGALNDSDHQLSGLVVAASGPIRSAKDLNGKTISGVSIGGIDHLGALAFIDKNGGDAKSITFIELPPAAVPAALDANRVAASMIAEPYLSTFRDNVRILGNAYDAIAPRFLATLWMATTGWAGANAPSVRAYAQSMLEANTWARTNTARAVTLLAAWTNTHVDRLRQPMAASLDPALIQPLLDTAVRYKFLAQPMNASDLIWSAKA